VSFETKKNKIASHKTRQPLAYYTTKSRSKRNRNDALRLSQDQLYQQLLQMGPYKKKKDNALDQKGEISVLASPDQAGRVVETSNP